MSTGTSILTVGNLKIGSSASTCTEVGDVVTAFRLQATRETVDIPPTLATQVKDSRASTLSWTIQIDCFADPDATTSTDYFNQMMAALADTSTASPPGSLYFEGSIKDGSVTTANPKWSGRFIPTSLGFGGTVNELSLDSGTHPLVGSPTPSYS
jgi:hypothetical protein